MTKYQIVIKRTDCIQCGNCWNVDPDHFESDDNGVSQVIHGETTPEISKGTFDDDKIDLAKQAQDECPVEIILVVEV